MTDQELDKLFKAKLDSREFEYNPSNWKAMESMLDQDKKGLAFFWWSSAAVVLFGMLVLGALWWAPVSERQITDQTQKGVPEAPVVSDHEDASQPSAAGESETTNTDQVTGENLDIAIQNNTVISGNEDDKPTTADSGTKVTSPAAPSEETPTSKYGEESRWAAAGENYTRAEPYQSIGLKLLSWNDLPYAMQPESSLLKPISPQAIDPAALRKFQAQHELWIQAGPDFTRSFNDNQLATGWLVGLQYRYRFARNWSFETGLNYNARTSLGITRTTDSVYFNFGQETLNTENRYKRLDYIEVPFTLGYDINPKHQFAAGFYTSVLINVNREKESTTFPFKGGVEIKTTDENGVSDAFNTLDYGLTGSYFFRYHPQMSLGLQFKYGFSDITTDRAEELNPHHRNVNARVILRYRLY